MSEEAQPAAPAKVDPETLAIRAKPARAIRFRRGVIIAIAAICSVSLIAVTWMALRPTIFRRVAEQTEMSEPNGKTAADALKSLPANYGDAPKLGPPLPGDLGRPILERQRQLALESPSTGQTAIDDNEAAERERLLAQGKAARESGVLVSSGATSPAVTAARSSSGDVPTVADQSKVALEPTNDPNAQGRKAAFVASLDPTGDGNPHRLEPAASPYILSAGSIISASLITGLRSDLPGLVTAQVTETVFDSPTGRILLVPQGARLVGSYDSVVAFGQKRALVVWQRLIMPDGSSLRIDNVPATDPSGYAGLQDKVDFHTWQLLKGIALSTLFGVGSELTLSGDSDLVQAIRQSTQANVSRAGDQITQRNLNIQPTIAIRPGSAVRLVVHKDLILAPWRQ
jgi:type IV secretory pathway VirB10-like protein